MWKAITANATKCSSELNDLIDPERANAKMQEEKQQANEDIRTAALDVESDPDRAVQRVDTALSVSDPMLLDIGAVTFLLSHLRDRAPRSFG